MRRGRRELTIDVTRNIGEDRPQVVRAVGIHVSAVCAASDGGVEPTLKAKVNRDSRKYVTLGACNPPPADRALHAELEVGLLIPYSLILDEENLSSTVVAAMAPLTDLGIVGDTCHLPAWRAKPTDRLRKARLALEDHAAALEPSANPGRL